MSKCGAAAGVQGVQILSSTSWNAATLPCSVPVAISVTKVESVESSKAGKKQNAKPQSKKATSSLENDISQLSISVSDLVFL